MGSPAALTSGARPAYAVFLRGINLARHRRVTNAELRAHFHTLATAAL